jgi:hypothetical protein
LFLSVFYRGTMRAFIAWLLVMLAILVASWLLREVITDPAHGGVDLGLDQANLFFERCLNPLVVWFDLMSDAMGKYDVPLGLPSKRDVALEARLVCVLGLMLYQLAALGLRLAANRLFQREGDRG